MLSTQNMGKVLHKLFKAVVYDIFFGALSYTSQPYAEAMYMRLAVSYTPYAISSRGKTGNIITFAQFEEGNSLSETHNLLSKNCDNT